MKILYLIDIVMEDCRWLAMYPNITKVKCVQRKLDIAENYISSLYHICKEKLENLSYSVCHEKL